MASAKATNPMALRVKPWLYPALMITFCNILGQAFLFITQMMMAAWFGAGTDVDAFLAANTVPQYINVVQIGTLGLVFIPVFLDYMVAGEKENAWKVAHSIINLWLLLMGLVMGCGMLFQEPILKLIAPGFSPQTLQLASQLSSFFWPTLLITGPITLLTGIYQAQGEFSWPALVLMAGALLNLVIALFFRDRLGITGMAIANLANLSGQLVLLAPKFFTSGRYRFTIDFWHPGVQKFLRLLLPLAISGLFIRWTPVVERYLASGFSEGSISRLDYAIRLITLLSGFISSGITTVIFPQMALRVTSGDFDGLGRIVSTGVRLMLLVVTPLISIGYVLALPLVSLLFQRGQFTDMDARLVADLTRVYLLAVLGICCGNITGRAFYALKSTNLLAVVGLVEASAYILYVTAFTHYFGVVGIAWSYTIYFTLSLLWQLILLNYKLGKQGDKPGMLSLMPIFLAAAGAGVAAWSVTIVTPEKWVQLFWGGVVGILTYIGFMLAMRVPEAVQASSQLWRWFRSTRQTNQV